MKIDDYFYPPKYTTPNPKADMLNAWRVVKRDLGLAKFKYKHMPSKY